MVGGGATGASLLWALAQDPAVCGDWEATLLHDGDQLGGHSLTVPIAYNGGTVEVDVGVQLISELVYPNVAVMLRSPDFADVPLTAFDDLRVGCAFPDQPRTGAPVNWGNFPAYQQGPDFALYSPEMAADARAFTEFIERSPWTGWAGRTVADFFRDPRGVTDPATFADYFVAPYLSIINGYGSANMDQVTFADLAPLFDEIPFCTTPLGSFSQPGKGWSRFTDGSSSWVRAMASRAATTLTTRVRLGATATAVWTDTDHPDRPVHVRWVSADGEREEVFDKVVLTTDMWTNAELLDNDRNRALWETCYAPYVAKTQWPLMWGECYVHTDVEILAPRMRGQLETLQFTAAYAGLDRWPHYDLADTYTTFILKNLMADPAADGLYLTMYGEKGRPARRPRPDTVKFHREWTHGMWSASYMAGPKKTLYRAQGKGWFPMAGQQDTNVYFAGNNTTTDSEEGALDSAMAIANYAFGSPYPLPRHHILAYGMFLLFYLDVMFPVLSQPQRMAVTRRLHRR